MPTLIPVIRFDAAIDSFYQNIKSRIQQINSSRIVAGLLMAQDWPPKNVKLNAFYLLNLTDVPASRDMNSATVQTLSRYVQWVWIIPGTPLQSNQQGANRGDRLRIHWQMQQELMQALYPYFCEKKNWARDGNGVWSGVAQVPEASIFWTRGEFKEQIDKESGSIYGLASLYICDSLEPVSS